MRLRCAVAVGGSLWLAACSSSEPKAVSDAAAGTTAALAGAAAGLGGANVVQGGTSGQGGMSGSSTVAAASGASPSAGSAPAPSSGCSVWDGIPSGKTLLVIGQDTSEIEAYGQKLGTPGGAMIYTNVADLAGFGEQVDFGTGAQSLPHWAEKAEPMVIQLGVSLKKSVNGDACAGDYLADIAAHTLDGPISSMAVQLAASRRPVLLRFGYEFDNTDCHRYQPAAYVQAFRQFATLLRTLGARNVLMVWHAWGGAPLDIAPFYPGDEFVDLVGVSSFPLAEAPGKLEAVGSFAQQHHKPFMIAEAAPQTAHPPSNPASWNAWYAGLFDAVERYDARVLSYINQDWNAQHVWASQHVWGDSRVQGSAIEPQWRKAVAAPRFLVSSPALYAGLACHD